MGWLVVGSGKQKEKKTKRGVSPQQRGDGGRASDQRDMAWELERDREEIPVLGGTKDVTHWNDFCGTFFSSRDKPGARGEGKGQGIEQHLCRGPTIRWENHTCCSRCEDRTRGVEVIDFVFRVHLPHLYDVMYMLLFFIFASQGHYATASSSGLAHIDHQLSLS